MDHSHFRFAPLAAAVVTAIATPVSASLLDEASDISTLHELVQENYNRYQGYNVAALPEGGFAVIWAEHYSSPSDLDDAVILQRFDATGQPTGEAHTLLQQDYQQGTSRFSQPAIAADEEGDLVVAWTTPGSHCYGKLFVQTLDADGDWSNLPEPNEITTNGCDPRLAMDADGDFALTWRNGDGEGRLRTFAANGVSYQNDEDIIFTYDLSTNPPTPALAMQSDGILMVAWTDAEDDYVYGQRFNLIGTTLDATAVRLDHGALSMDEIRQHSPALSAYGDDGFVAFWNERKPTLQADIDEIEIKGLRWHGDGTPGKSLIAGSTLVSDNYSYKLTEPAVATDSSGNVLVAWQGRVYGEKPDTHMTHLDDRLNIAELAQPYVDPDTLYSSSNFRHAPRLVMSDDRPVLVWTRQEQEDAQPRSILARTFPTLVEAVDTTDENLTDEDNDSDDDSGSSGGAGSPLLFALLALLGYGRWKHRLN